MTVPPFINFVYIIAALLFALGLRLLGSPETARRGNFISAAGMLLAVGSTLISRGLAYQWIILGAAIGAVAGILAARTVAMTAMPEMVALLNGFGGLASLLVGWSVYHLSRQTDVLTMITVFLTVLIGGVTFTGSLVAWGKLSAKIPERPVLFPGQQPANVFMLVVLLAAGAALVRMPSAAPVFLAAVFFSLVLGALVVIPIGGADMPVVISLLNSYSGLAACASGFVVRNDILIVAGAFVGASGLILTNIMCKAMNRSLSHVLFSGFGAVVQERRGGVAGEVKPIDVHDAYYILEAARSLVIIPGYGLAAAQAQHVIRELGDLLEANGAEVRYAIHPVAGRMPGHMNVLLAEANVPYDRLVEMDDINPVMETIDVCLVVGANDIVNPAALKDPGSSIYGMPIIETFRARTVFVLKRSMAAGFSGVSNDLFYYDNVRMLFGDAKASLQGLVAEFKNR